MWACAGRELGFLTNNGETVMRVTESKKSGYSY